MRRTQERSVEADHRLATPEARASLRSGVLRAHCRYGLRLSLDDIEDLTQEAALKALSARAPTTNPRAYFKQIGFSVAVEEVRKRGAKKRGANVTTSLSELAEVPAHQVSPEARCVSRELLRERLALCRFTLSEGTFRIFVLAAVLGLPSIEVARLLETKPSTVDSVICRARRQLAACGLHLRRRQ